MRLILRPPEPHENIMPNETTISLADHLDAAFLWEETDELYGAWYNVVSRLKYGCLYYEKDLHDDVKIANTNTSFVAYP